MQPGNGSEQLPGKENTTGRQAGKGNEMKKMWKVTVNGWGWDMPMTYFAESREEAQRVSEKHPASDGVEYAGRFTDENAADLPRWHPYC